MTDFRFAFDWKAGADYGTEEYGATFADFAIYVGDDCVTEYVAQEDEGKRVRESIRRPLYSVAEWLVANWWSLLFESFTSGRNDEGDYVHRHNIRYARDGFALPNLTFRPEGEEVALHWKSVKLSQYKTKFISEGYDFVERGEFEAAVANFLDAVDDRLAEHGITETPFQNEWEAIRSAGKEEAEFCRAAARLGFYPYGLSETQEQAILDAAERIPELLYPAFFGAAQGDMLEDQVDRLTDIIEVIESLDVEADQLQKMRRQFPKFHSEAPWSEGYKYARRVRGLLGLEDQRFDSTDQLAETFGLPRNGSRESVQEHDSQNLFDALVAITHRGGPGFAVDKRRDENKKFALCRGLFEYLNSSNGHPLLVTQERTDQQQRNRAFAAEFLAPSSLLEDAVSGHTVDDDEIGDIAERFSVSPLVVHFQLKNHDIVREFGYDLPEIELG